MGRFWKPVQNLLNILIYLRLGLYIIVKLCKLIFCGQFPKNEEITDFQKVGLLRQFLNGITSISKNSLFPIQKCYRTFAGTRIFITGIQGHYPISFVPKIFYIYS